MIENTFLTFPDIDAGLVYDDRGHKSYPIRYYTYNRTVLVPTDVKSSWYGFIQKGFAQVTGDGFQWQLSAGQSFSVCGNGHLSIIGHTILIEVLHDKGKYPDTLYRAENRVVGPLEGQGRLAYIDGCTDSLLIPPVKLGDPCLNHLCFPSGIDQTTHTHPSHRIGVIHSGSGRCVTPFGDVELEAGMVFMIREWDGKKMRKGLDGKRHPQGAHKFQTFDEAMHVVAFHPDSDYGPTDVIHPMINRTIVDGIPASQIPNIQTGRV